MKMTTCIYCHKTSVPIERWNMRCDNCRKYWKAQQKRQQQHIGVSQRQAAAVIVPDGTNTKVYVDKFGKEVENPGYDLKHDPRGWKYTGEQGPEKSMIK